MFNNFRTYQLAKELYGQCKRLQLTPILRDQLERASLSVVLNLAEGAGKLTIKDKRKFYAISLGSTREIQAIFDLLGEKELFQKADILAASIYKLIQNTRTLDTI